MAARAGAAILDLRKRATGLAAPVVAGLAVLLFFGSPGAAVEEQLLNANLSKGAGSTPDHWRTESWDQRPSVTSFQWIRPSGGAAGQLEVDSRGPNDARWMQSLSVTAGWYFFSAEIRTEDVPAEKTGASISVLEDGIMSPELKGTTGWTREGFYLKVGPRGADIEVALRLGGYGSLNRGRAFFRKPSVVRVSAPAQDAQTRFDLAEIRKASQTPPIGRPWTLVAVFVLLGAIAVAGWRLYGEATLRPVVGAAEKPQEPKKSARAPARHQKRRRS